MPVRRRVTIHTRPSRQFLSILDVSCKKKKAGSHKPIIQYSTLLSHRSTITMSQVIKCRLWSFPGHALILKTIVSKLSLRFDFCKIKTQFEGPNNEWWKRPELAIKCDWSVNPDNYRVVGTRITCLHVHFFVDWNTCIQMKRYRIVKAHMNEWAYILNNWSKNIFFISERLSILSIVSCFAEWRKPSIW